MNNPGNIRKSNDKWVGLSEDQPDSSFFKFDSMAYGYRAMIKLLKNYSKIYGCKTVSDYICRWAPPTENNTDSYVKAVCNKTGMQPSDILSTEDKEEMCNFVVAMAEVESGIPMDKKFAIMGYSLL